MQPQPPRELFDFQHKTLLPPAGPVFSFPVKTSSDAHQTGRGSELLFLRKHNKSVACWELSYNVARTNRSSSSRFLEALGLPLAAQLDVYLVRLLKNPFWTSDFFSPSLGTAWALPWPGGGCCQGNVMVMLKAQPWDSTTLKSTVL